MILEEIDLLTLSLSVQCHWCRGRKQLINVQNVIEGPSRDVQTDISTSTAIVEYNFIFYWNLTKWIC